MDGTSPGNMPLSLGNVWCGETRSMFGATAVEVTTGAPAGPCPHCGCTIVDAHIAGCPVHEVAAGATRVRWLEHLTDEERRRMVTCAPNPWVAQQAGAALFGALPIAPSLSDADVERIAHRVVELLAARGTTP